MSNVTLEEFAKMFNCSVPGVRDFIRRGMPKTVEAKKGAKTGRRGRPHVMVSIEEGREWMIKNGVRCFKKSMAKNAPKTTEPIVLPDQFPVSSEQDEKLDPKKPKDWNMAEGLEGAIERLRTMELRSFSDYVEALNSGNTNGQALSMKLHADSVAQMLKAEAELNLRKEMETEIWEEVRKDIRKWAEPVRVMLDSMPRAIAPRANPQDPALAEKSLRDWLDNQLLPSIARMEEAKA